MREIKFKAWSWDTRYPDYEKKNYILDVLKIDFENRIVVLPYKIDKTREESFDNIELMQYTGLKDLSGLEIFEGDIIKNINPESEAFGEIASVDYHPGICGFTVIFESIGQNKILGMYENIGIIGNIYETPEFLK